MNKILEVENLTFKYEENQEAPTLDGVSFAVQSGEWVSIIGQNGSGKSTTARAIDGLLENVSGNIKIDGQILSAENVWALRQKIGMVFQNPDNQFVGATVEDDVAFGMENQGIPREEMILRVDQALKQVNMLEFKGKEPARLSGGQKQRVAIAGIIALRPEIIILDEATSMLDPTGRAEIMRVIREIKAEYNLTVLSITHDLDEATLSDRVLVMRAGKIIKSAKPEELFGSGEDMINFGLDMPFTSNLAEDLRADFNLPEKYLNEEELAELLAERLRK
ncbi:energy-coupling factor ABC transporter ATP-binding protein [Lactococcus formosensis]|jgi:ABC-type cobalt transport system, ATPase component|uniref:Energy-coupling factor ABC transporter ATP-binding protein n=1 Tax=Lactococcus formosensis TaxID=1281486 RepID=A0A9Q8Y1B1_9LACT|nr:energy-coupling factor ABC transporter ATP-binding protein [Lactococcus formosensis]NHI99761.1 energy-coupling factor ABC transporter ATP-binding protein [Lactococcus garvieae]MCH1723728.1 energy-coupling factor ABC transporter ATP-binding protein [Lactococcus formosensis]MCO7180839.1 energy-coupling factor ABC transporter ATP-binding protein [Lactococcus formosensis]MDG6111774.1 energy-coupling factor ABC transporter ATP-binding protein [Lactococcus formosensis]MDG6114069.1 energy-coupling